MVLRPEASPGPLNYVKLLPPQPASGGLAQWFQQAVAARTRSLPGWKPGAVKQSSNNGVPSIETTGQATAPGGERLLRAYMGMIDSRGRGLLMESQFESSAVLRNLLPYGALVKSLGPAGGSPTAASGAVAANNGSAPTRPVPATGPRSSRTSTPQTPAGIQEGATAEPAPAPPNGHDLYDWFGRFYSSVMPGPNFTISQVMVWEFYRFFPNGYVWEGGAPFNVDPGALNCPGTVNKSGKCKHYQINGSTLTIEGEKPHTLGRDGNGLKIDNNSYNRVRKAGAPFNGTWKTSAGGGIGSTVTLSQHTLTMRPDGTFSINGSTGAVSPNASAYGSSGNSGHYKLTPYTIEFDYADGHTARQALMLPYKDNGSFLIGEALYFIPTETGSRKR